MTNETAAPNPDVSNQWKQVFETAVDELGGKSDPARKMPIAKRIRIARPPVDAMTAQKRAIADAAAALAALWQSPDTSRQPRARRNPDDRNVSFQRVQQAHSF